MFAACDRSVVAGTNSDAGVDASTNNNNQNDAQVPVPGTLTYKMKQFIWPAPSEEAWIPINFVTFTAELEDAWIRGLTFTLYGDIDPAEVVEVQLFREDPLELVAINYVWDGDLVNFDLSADPIVIPKGESRRYSLRVRLEADPCADTIGFDIARDHDISAVGAVYGLPLSIQEDPLSEPVNVVPVVGRQIAFTSAPTNPGPADVSAGVDDHTFVAYNISASMGVEVQRTIVHVQLSDPQDADYFSDLKFWMRNANNDWVVVAGPLELSPQMCQQDGVCGIGMMGDTYDLPACQTSQFKVTMDILPNAPAGITAFIEIPGDSFLMVSSIDASDVIQPEDISGGSITGGTQEIIN